MKKEERFYEKLVLALLLLGTGFLYYNAATAKIVSPDSDMASMDFPKRNFDYPCGSLHW